MKSTAKNRGNVDRLKRSLLNLRDNWYVLNVVAKNRKILLRKQILLLLLLQKGIYIYLLGRLINNKIDFDLFKPKFILLVFFLPCYEGLNFHLKKFIHDVSHCHLR
jgi:hypothetical protein